MDKYSEQLNNIFVLFIYLHALVHLESNRDSLGCKQLSFTVVSPFFPPYTIVWSWQSAAKVNLQIEGNDSLLENCALFPHWEGINVCFMVLWMSHRKVNWWGHNKRHLYPNVNPYQCSSIAWSYLNLELWHLGGLWGRPVDSPSRWQLPGHLALEEDLVWESTRPPSRNWKTLMYKRVCGIPCLYLMCFHIKRWE